MRALGLVAVLLIQLSAAIPQVHEASITGRVTGPSLEPIDGLSVWLFRPEFDWKRRELHWTFAAVVLTDGRGEYRHVGLAPGRYYLAAGSLPPTVVPGTVTIPGRQLTLPLSDKRRYETAFYPGEVDSTKAVALDVKPGVEWRDTNFFLKELRTFAIRGRFVNKGSVQAANARVGVTLSLLYRDSMVTQTAPNDSGRVTEGAGDIFEITAVPPGRYWVGVTLLIINGPLPTPRPPPRTPEEEAAGRRAAESILASGLFQIVNGVATVDVVDRDVDGVVVLCKAATAIQGQIFMEGGERLSGADRMRVSIHPLGHPNSSGVFEISSPLEVAPDGTFGSPIFLPWDTHRLEVSGLPEDVYVKAAHFGPKDILGNSFPISGPTTDRFEVVLSSKGGRVDGKVGGVVSGEDRPLPNAAVVLVPSAQLQRIDLYRMTTTDESGEFTIRGLAPGEYKAFAFETASDSYRAFEPNFASLSDSGGVALSVVESKSAVVKVRVNSVSF